MSKQVFCPLYILVLLFFFCCSEEKPTPRSIPLKPSIDANSPTGVYIPEGLEDCFFELNRMLPSEFIKKIK